MRYLTIPKNVTLDMFTNKDGEPISYPFANEGAKPGFLDEYVWPSKLMREHTQLAVALIEKLEAVKPGDVVELTDGEHEQLHKAAQEAVYPRVPGLDRCLMRFQHAIASATREPPVKVSANGKREVRDEDAVLRKTGTGEPVEA